MPYELLALPTSSQVPYEVLALVSCGSVASVLKQGKIKLDRSSYKPITTECNISKALAYMLLPFINMNASFGEKQIGFRSGIGDAHPALTFLLKGVSAKGSSHLCS